MNWKKLIIGITIVNLLGWAMIELWSRRYANGNVAMGAGFMIFTQLVGYYIVVIGSLIKVPPTPPASVKPWTCQKHDWQPAKYDPAHREECMCCGAERGKV